jgi:hypothetical protein
MTACRVCLALLLMLLTACSYESRQFWGRAFQQAGDDVMHSRTTYCTTRYRQGVAYTSCY